MSVTKVNKSTIIRRPDYARKNADNISQVEVSNKDAQLNNNIFQDLILNYDEDENKKQDKKESKKDQEKKEEKPKSNSTKDEYGRTDFYV